MTGKVVKTISSMAGIFCLELSSSKMCCCCEIPIEMSTSCHLVHAAADQSFMFAVRFNVQSQVVYLLYENKIK
jgi:hypothetical protein